MMNARNLAMRDPALAALVGIETGADFGMDAPYPGDFNGDFGYDFGAEPTPQEALELWRKQQGQVATGRAAYLKPNAGYAEKIQRYAFTIAPAANPAFGVAAALLMQGNPRVTIRPQRVVSNVPAPGLATFATLEIANVNAFVGAGATDGFVFNANGTGVSLDLPTITPAYPVSVTGAWLALVPAGYVQGAAFPISMTFLGPADMVG